MTDVLVIGGVGIDTIVRVPELPLPDRETVASSIASYVGHTGNGVAVGCHRLGLRTAVADVIGDDAEGERIRQHFTALGLPFEFHIAREGTRRSVNLVAPGGRRISLYDGRQAPGPDNDLWRPGIAAARHVHVSIMDFARHALADAIEAGRDTSTDLHDWDGHQDHHQDFAFGADLVFLSTSALTEPVADVAARIFERGRARAVVAMAGAHGSHLVLPGTEPQHVPAGSIDGRPVVDTNGAGDAYVAAFLATRLRGGDWLAAARAGSIAGAWACGSPGTHTDLITESELSAASG